MAGRGIGINFQPVAAPQSWSLQKAGSSSPHWEKEPQSLVAWSQGCAADGAMLGIQQRRVWGCWVYGHRRSALHRHLCSPATNTTQFTPSVETTTLGQCTRCSI